MARWLSSSESTETLAWDMACRAPAVSVLDRSSGDTRSLHIVFPDAEIATAPFASPQNSRLQVADWDRAAEYHVRTSSHRSFVKIASMTFRGDHW